MIVRAFLLKLAENRSLTGFLARKGMSTGFARRFVAGEKAEEAVEQIRRLNELGISATFDHLGENVHDLQQASREVEVYFELLDLIEKHRLDANVSLKLTQLGLDLSEEVCLENMRRILTHAKRSENFVRIDMEGSAYTQTTLNVFRKLWAESKNVGIVIQSYLYRSGEDIEELNRMGARVRLCKGAYKEPRKVAYPRKLDVDASYRRLASRLLESGNYPGLATHDPAMISHVQSEAKRLGRAPDTYEFQMLYGIRAKEQERLRGEGYRMRVYVPYGGQWLPYFMRRIAERPANALFVLNALVRG
jgi:proline dehydrogenase